MADPPDRTDAPTAPAAAGAGVAAPDDAEELDTAALTVAAPEVLADSLQEYMRAWLVRIRGGGSGALPIIAGLIALVIFFQIEQSSFLTSVNIVNLLVQAAGSMSIPANATTTAGGPATFVADTANPASPAIGTASLTIGANASITTSGPLATARSILRRL